MVKEKGDWRWGSEKVLKDIAVEVKIEDMRKLNRGKEERREIVWIRVEKEEHKKMI